MFLTLMVIGLVGLVVMAIPAFGHAHGALSGHGHGLSGIARGASHGAIGHGAHGAAHPGGGGARNAAEPVLPADAVHASWLRFVPSPRATSSVLALFGAFGNAAVHAFHFPPLEAALGAAVLALSIEWFLVRRLWNLVFKLQAEASSPLEQLVLSEGRAVVPFRNGRGMISTVRDGRQVQLAANLREDQRNQTVKVGDRLLIEDVDARRERVIVSIRTD